MELTIQEVTYYNDLVKNNKAPLLLGQSAIKKLGEIKFDLKENTLTILSGKGSNDFYKNNQSD